MSDSFPPAPGAGSSSFPREPALRDDATVQNQGELLFRRYRVMRELGRGGMGVVVLAHDTALDIPVAVKLVPDLVVKDTEAVADLRKEVLRGMALMHPGIVRTNNFEKDESGAGIVMEIVEGDTLTDLKIAQPGGCFDPEQIIPWLEQLCAVLDYAHGDAHIVHRDLKPRNIMLAKSGRVKVADFGIAAVISDSMSRHSMEGTVSGTLSYMSPQQAEGKRPTPLDDIHALGATIYELLTGKPPFFRGNPTTILAQIISLVPPSMMERRVDLEVTGRPALPLVWEEVIAACLAKDPAERPQTAGEVLARLRSAPSSVEARFVSPSPPPPAASSVVEPEAATLPSHPAPSGRRSRAPLMWAACAAAVVVGGVVIYRNRPPVSNRPTASTSSSLTQPAQAADTSPHPIATPPLAMPAPVVLASPPPATPPPSALDEPDPPGFPADQIARRNARRAFVRAASDSFAKIPSLDVNTAASDVSGNGKVWALASDGLHVFEDTDGDGKADKVIHAVAPPLFPSDLAPDRFILEGHDRKLSRIMLLKGNQHVAELQDTDGDGGIDKSIRLNSPTPPPQPLKPGAATKDRPFINSLGQEFVPVADTNVLFSRWETRVKDYRRFVEEGSYDMTKGERAFTAARDAKGNVTWAQEGGTWSDPKFPQPQGDDHPVVCVSWEDARAFCEWLTRTEHASGRISPEATYRLPTDHEWSLAAGLGAEESVAMQPLEKSENARGGYPWGSPWPPPANAANLCGVESRVEAGEASDWTFIDGYGDGAPRTAPVGSYLPTAQGLYDLSGNVWEWCEDRIAPSDERRVLRGGSWYDDDPDRLLASYRRPGMPRGRWDRHGFRAVLDPAPSQR